MTDIEDKIRQALREDLELAVRELFGDEELFINKKTGTNTLADSRLRNTGNVSYDGNAFNIFLNIYWEYVERGRKPFEKRVPIDALREWANRKIGRSDNRILYAIQQSIYQNGINPRPIIEPMERMLNEGYDKKWAEKIFDQIISDLEEIFK